MHKWKVQVPKARLGHIKNGNEDRSQTQQGREGVGWGPGGTLEQGPQGAELSWESPSSGRGNGMGRRLRSLLRSKDEIHPEPRPLLARWFRRSLSICSSVNYPVLPPACLLWWQPEQLSRNSICSPVLLPSTAHQHFRVERCPISLGRGLGAQFVPWWSWPQALTPLTAQQIKPQQRSPGPWKEGSVIFISHPVHFFQSHSTVYYY